MNTSDRLKAGRDALIRKAGTQFRIQYFSLSTGSVWDDDVTLSQSGADLYSSGIVLPLDTKQGTFDSILLEQGKLNNNDTKLYTNGNLFLGSNLSVKVNIGSPVDNKRSYTLHELGTIVPEVGGTKIYKKIYLRRLTTGSL